MNSSLVYLVKRNPFNFAYLLLLVWFDIFVSYETFPSLGSLSAFWIIVSITSIVMVTCGIVLLIRNVYLVHGMVSNPVVNLFGKEEIEEPDTATLAMVEELAKKEGISTPKVVVISSPVVGSFGLDSDNALILIGKEIIQALNDKELKSVLMHEIFHIMSDLWYSTSFLVFKNLLLKPVNVALISVVGLVLGGIRIGLVFVPLPPDMYLKLFLIPDLVGFGAFLLLVLHRASKVFGPGALSSTKHMFFREFLADAYAAISLNDASSLRSAAIKIARLNLNRQINSHLISFTKSMTVGNAESAKFQLDSTTRSSITEAVSALSSPKVSIKEVEDTLLTNRVGIIELLAKMMTDGVDIRMDAKEPFRLTRTIISVTPESTAYILSKHKKTFPQIMDALSHTSRINLISASASLGIEPFDLFVISLFLSSRGLMKFSTFGSD